MTTYLGEKAVGVGTIKTYVAVADVLHDNTLVGNGNTEPLGVNTENIVSQQTLANTVSVLNTAIDGQAEAIAKTREDYIQADSEIHQILNNHAGELTTLRGNQASLGDQVSNIESKIPESASDTNPLITKQQLLDEEMDIRDDYNEMVSELQTQITAHAGAIAGKQDELTAGEGIKIENNVISATGGGGSGSANVVHDSTLIGAGTSASPLGLSEAVKDEIADKAPKETVEALTTAVNDIYTGLAGKQDKLTAGENITIEDGVISATGGGELPDNVVLNNSIVDGGIAIGKNASSTQNTAVALGRQSKANNTYTTSIGYDSYAGYMRSTAIGAGARVSTSWAIQVGYGTNNDSNTFKVGLSASNNYELLSADGTIPAARHATLPTEDGTYVLKCVISGGVPTMTWVKE